MKILKVKIRVPAALNNHRGLVEPGSQLTSALNEIKLPEILYTVLGNYPINSSLTNLAIITDQRFAV